MSLTFPVDAKLKDGSPVQLVLADQQDVELLRRFYQVIVEEGTENGVRNHFQLGINKKTGTLNSWRAKA